MQYASTINFNAFGLKSGVICRKKYIKKPHSLAFATNLPDRVHLFSPENLSGLQFKPNQFPAFCKSYHQSYIKLYQTSPLEMARDWYFLGSLKLNVDYINSNLYKLGCAYGMSEVAIFNVCHLLTIKLFLFFVFNSLSNDFYILMSFLLFNNRIEQIYIPHMS